MNSVEAWKALLSGLSLLASSCAAGFPAGASGVGREDPSATQPFDSSESVAGAIADASFPGAPAPPGDVADLALRGDFAVRQHRLEDAARLFDAAARAAPRGESWRYERALADVLLGLRRDGEAERIYSSLESSGAHPRSSTLHGNLAVARYRLGDAAGSRAAAEDALRINPGNAEALKTLGLVELLEGNKESGAKRLQTALEANPRIPEAQAALARLEAEAGQTSGALSRYRKLLEWLPDALQSDYHRRWRDLFFPSPRTTAEELRARIEALETPSTGQKTGDAAVRAPWKGATKTP